MEFLPSAIVKPGYIPPGLEKYRIPIANAFTYISDEVSICSQRIRLQLFTIQFHIITCHTATTIQPRSQKDLLTIHYMLKGEIDAWLQNGDFVPLNEGRHNMVWVPGNIDHRADVSPGVYWCFHIDLHENARQFLADSITTFPVVMELASRRGGVINPAPMETDSMEALIIEKILACKLTGPTARKFFTECANELLIQFAEKYVNTIMKYLHSITIKDQDLANIFALQVHLNTNLQDTRELMRIAKDFNLSPQALEDGFRAVFGRSADEYYNSKRMMRAFELLGNSDLPYNAVAYLVGYGDFSKFRDAFHVYFGKFPSEIRLTFR
ncbi:AraC family transcriptional regulator [Chitinophaga tropicalis]|uniref:Helix-turn-helix domain-containing protein n=1 Tax=Chitinophaga tropicalis TaxID=2683588 RepID=A0A7K1UBU8_9BACT|nr:helix-turn-helix domain-containing protein [Chitinophaga tropicalis]MVT11867.1 helix-turn-helix domain-containing protein [Chitinophaga tropicalis]